MAGLVDGKATLITGAASGIGAAAARIFAREGARLVISDVQIELGTQVAKELEAQGAEAHFISWKLKLHWIHTSRKITCLIESVQGCTHVGQVLARDQLSPIGEPIRRPGGQLLDHPLPPELDPVIPRCSQVVAFLRVVP